MPNDPNPVPVGTRGTVTECTWLSVWNQWQVWVNWDNGRTLSMVVPPDKARKIDKMRFIV